jgi:hypothetical protein
VYWRARGHPHTSAAVRCARPRDMRWHACVGQTARARGHLAHATGVRSSALRPATKPRATGRASAGSCVRAKARGNPHASGAVRCARPRDRSTGDQQPHASTPGETILIWNEGAKLDAPRCFSYYFYKSGMEKVLNAWILGVEKVLDAWILGVEKVLDAWIFVLIGMKTIFRCWKCTGCLHFYTDRYENSTFCSDKHENSTCSPKTSHTGAKKIHYCPKRLLAYKKESLWYNLSRGHTLVRKTSIATVKIGHTTVFFILFLGVKKVLGACIFILIGMKTVLFVVIDMKTVLAHRKHLTLVRKRSITVQNVYWHTKKSRCGTI